MEKDRLERKMTKKEEIHLVFISLVRRTQELSSGIYNARSTQYVVTTRMGFIP